jgi:hypothetical protein
MALPCLFVDDSPVPADLYVISTVVLVESYEFDATVTVPVVVPVDE